MISPLLGDLVYMSWSAPLCVTIVSVKFSSAIEDTAAMSRSFATGVEPQVSAEYFQATQLRQRRCQILTNFLAILNDYFCLKFTSFR